MISEELIFHTADIKRRRCICRAEEIKTNIEVKIGKTEDYHA